MAASITTKGTPVVPTAPTTTLTTKGGVSVEVSKYGDRLNWVRNDPTNPNSVFHDLFFDAGNVCPVCSHDIGTHCEPYHPTSGVLMSRCSDEVEVHSKDAKGNDVVTVRRCGTCVRQMA